DTITGGAGSDRFVFTHNYNASNFAAQARVTDFVHGADSVELAWTSGAVKQWVLNSGDQHFGPLSTTAGSQTLLGNAGDTLADVFYSTDGAGHTQLIVDVNDDGKLDSNDLVINFDGNIAFGMDDFVAGTFKVQRGGAGADVMT